MECAQCCIRSHKERIEARAFSYIGVAPAASSSLHAGHRCDASKMELGPFASPPTSLRKLVVSHLEVDYVLCCTGIGCSRYLHFGTAWYPKPLILGISMDAIPLALNRFGQGSYVLP